MSVILNLSLQSKQESFVPGSYTRIFKFENCLFKISLSFTDSGKIRISPGNIQMQADQTSLTYKTFGQILRIQKFGKNDFNVYYTYYFSDNLLYLCALNDEYELRKSILTGSWRREHQDRQ